MNIQLMSRRSNRHGGVSVFVAIVLIALIGCVALAIDVGYIAVTKTSMQAAADSAVLSGGTELKSSLGRTPIPAATMRPTRPRLPSTMLHDMPMGMFQARIWIPTAVMFALDGPNSTAQLVFGT